MSLRTFSQIQTEVFNQLKEDSSDPEFWSEQEVKDALNDTYMFIADESHCFRFDRIIEIKIGIRIYKMPFDYVLGSLYRVEFDSKVIYPISSMELDTYSKSWRNAEGSNITNYIPPGDICNTDEIAVYPKPDTNGAAYNLASETEDNGVITTVGDTSYEEFEQEDGVIVDTDGNARFIEEEGTGPVQEIQDSSGNLRVFGARYPKRLFKDNEVFLHPISQNPRRILTHGALALLFSKEGEGKDIAKASYYNKRFNETVVKVLNKQRVKRTHRMRSVTEISVGNNMNHGLNLGDNYPVYIR